MSQSFDKLKTSIIDIFKNDKNDKYKKYTIIEEPQINKDSDNIPNEYIFYIKLKENTEITISSVTIDITSVQADAVSTPKRRKHDKTDKEVDVFYIKTLYTMPEHQKKSLAILLLMYAISYMKTQDTFTDVLYSTLDDCSDKSIYLKNLYHKLGYVPCDLTSLNDSQGSSSIGHDGDPLKLELAGPEKKVELYIFLPRAYEVIKDIKRNIQGGGKKIKRKSYKRKSYKRKSYK